MPRSHHTSYDAKATAQCERALVTLIGDIGPWSHSIYLVGGLAPRYIVDALPQGVPPHIGTTDVDLVIGLALGDDAPETYVTLQTNLNRSGFTQGRPSFQWTRTIDATTVTIEFLCETDQVDTGKIYRPKGGTGSKITAFNVPGAQLVTRDWIERSISAERLDDGGLSQVTVRVAGVLSFAVLKTLAFQDRHNNKDAYDLIFVLANHPGGPAEAGTRARHSPIVDEPQVTHALELLQQRFASPEHDGPSAYANFLAAPDDTEASARYRNEAVAVVDQFLRGLEAQTRLP